MRSCRNKLTLFSKPLQITNYPITTMNKIDTCLYEVDRSDIVLLPSDTQVLMFDCRFGVYKLSHAGKIKHMRRNTVYFIFDLPRGTDNATG